MTPSTSHRWTDAASVPPPDEDPSWSSRFEQIAEMRREDDASIEQGAWAHPCKRADWAGVMAACDAALASDEKDLRLAAWWCEAAACRGHWRSVADGLGGMAALLQRWGDALHPRDAETRSGLLAWLARRLERLSVDAAKARAWAAGGELPTPALVIAWQALATCCGGASSAADRTSQALQALVDAALPAGASSGEPAAADAATRPDAPAGLAGPPMHERAQAAEAAEPFDRLQAVAELRRLAARFRAHEPHSPVGYLLERAAAWSAQPLHVWMREVVRDGATLAALEDLLGVAGRDHPP